jgi:hypothetical protein
MNHRPLLDVPAFQKLLEAAWVLQCERNRELSASHNGPTILAVPSGKDEWNAALAPTFPGNVFEPARAIAEAHPTPIYEIIAPSVVPNPSPVAPIYQRTEVVGALALAVDRHCSPLRDPIPFPAPDVSKKAARGKNETDVAQIGRRVTLNLVWFGDKYRVALRLVPFSHKYKDKYYKDKEHSLSTPTASNFKRASRGTAAYAGPAVVLLIMLVFSFSLPGIHRPILTAVKAALLAPKVPIDKIAVDKIVLDKVPVDKIAADASPTRAYVGQAPSPVAAASEHPRTDLPVLAPTVPAPTVPEPSHLRVTDPAASSLVAGLCPYEIQTVRQQAQYGDAVAALTLGMAYEIGRHVPRSCTEAAHWVAVAAKEGNSAAQYNLALRYISGDGTPTNLDKARKWLERAAAHGYQKAQLTLQASRF